MEQGCDEGAGRYALFCTMAFWDSWTMNCWSSRLSLSESLEKSICCSEVMSIIGTFRVLMRRTKLVKT